MTMSKRKIIVVITARASYSRFREALISISRRADIDLGVILAAGAVSEKYGNIINLVKSDGLKLIAKCSVLVDQSFSSMAKTTGLLTIELSSIFHNEQPDLVITIADRFETISTAIAASYSQIPLIHIQGGEITGNIDERVRHAISKLSDYHFVSNSEAKERLIQMGENPINIFVTGCPSIDIARIVKNDISNYNIDSIINSEGIGSAIDVSQDFLVVLQHSETSTTEMAENEIQLTLKAVMECRKQIICFWPNFDSGSDNVSKGLRKFRESNKGYYSGVRFIKNLTPENFLAVLLHSKCLVGNSSVGIRECSYLGVPVVNIGYRQNGRRRGKNVLDVNHDVLEISKAISLQMGEKYGTEEIYGDGYSAQKIADLFDNNFKLYNKKFNNHEK